MPHMPLPTTVAKFHVSLPTKKMKMSRIDHAATQIIRELRSVLTDPDDIRSVAELEVSYKNRSVDSLSEFVGKLRTRIRCNSPNVDVVFSASEMLSLFGSSDPEDRATYIQVC